MKANATLRENAAHAWSAVKGDGCTDVPDFTEAFTRCCDQHDADYTTGADENGRRLSRARADRRLYLCLKCAAVTFAGKYVIAPAYWIGVRLFGKSHWRKT